MKLSTILAIFLLLTGCISDKKNTAVEKHYTTLTEYKNEYEGYKILKSTLFEYNILAERRDLFSVGEHAYIYEGDRLVRKEEYLIREGKKNLTDITNYGERSEERIGINYNDTVSYVLEIFDNEHRVIKLIKKTHMVVPELDFYVDRDFEEECAYDAATGEQNFWLTTDKKTGETTRTYMFENEIPPGFIADSKTSIIISRKEHKGDTVITRNYSDGEPGLVYKSFVNGNCSTELSFNADNNLEMVFKVINEDDLRIEISELPEMHSIDSIFIRNGRTVKSVMISSSGKHITTYDYDEHGNPLRTVLEVYFVESAERDINI